MKKEQLKKWRKKMGLTQEQMAEFIGHSRWAIMKWEQGITDIPEWVDIIVRLVKKKHIRGINENTRTPLPNRGNVLQGKAVSRHRQKARAVAVRVEGIS
jgi:transcriptional regulator with XRE-family HTH domain